MKTLNGSFLACNIPLSINICSKEQSHRKKWIIMCIFTSYADISTIIHEKTILYIHYFLPFMDRIPIFYKQKQSILEFPVPFLIILLYFQKSRNLYISPIRKSLSPRCRLKVICTCNILCVLFENISVNTHFSHLYMIQP